jgi:hypothetical protein
MTVERGILSPEIALFRKYSDGVLLSQRGPLNAPGILVRLLHHDARHLHLGEAGGNLEQSSRLCAFLYIAQLSAAIFALPLHRKAQLGVEPEVADIATRVRGFLL